MTKEGIQMTDNLYGLNTISMYQSIVTVFLGSLASSRHIKNGLCCCEAWLGWLQRQPPTDMQSLHSPSSLKTAKLYNSMYWVQVNPRQALHWYLMKPKRDTCLCITSDHLKSFTDITFSRRPTYSVHLLRGQKHLQGEQLQKNSLEDCNWVGLESQEDNWIWTEFFTSRTAQTLRIYIHPYDLVMRRSDGTSQIKVTIVCFSIFPIGKKPDMI